MEYEITTAPLADKIRKQIFAGFSEAAIQATGIDGLADESISFQIQHGNKFIGAVVVQMFWGQLHIKYLYVDEHCRGQGIGRMLMEHTLAWGRQQACDFAFVETMSFQAPGFYKKFGFEAELIRNGYAKETSFYYMKKDL